MKYATGSAFRRALETRLRTLSQREGVPLARLRKLVAFDRLLARLLQAEPETWVLKGGLALQLRLGPARPYNQRRGCHVAAVSVRPAPTLDRRSSPRRE